MLPPPHSSSGPVLGASPPDLPCEALTDLQPRLPRSFGHGLVRHKCSEARCQPVRPLHLPISPEKPLEGKGAHTFVSFPLSFCPPCVEHVSSPGWKPVLLHSRLSDSVEGVPGPGALWGRPPQGWENPEPRGGSGPKPLSWLPMASNPGRVRSRSLRLDSPSSSWRVRGGSSRGGVTFPPCTLLLETALGREPPRARALTEEVGRLALEASTTGAGRLGSGRAFWGQGWFSPNLLACTGGETEVQNHTVGEETENGPPASFPPPTLPTPPRSGSVWG